jgi:hypothetical protein
MNNVRTVVKMMLRSGHFILNVLQIWQLAYSSPLGIDTSTIASISMRAVVLQPHINILLEQVRTMGVFYFSPFGNWVDFRSQGAEEVRISIRAYPG